MTKEQEHWKNDPKSLRLLYGTAKALGITDSSRNTDDALIHGILGVRSLEDYQGTVDQAVAELKGWAEATAFDRAVRALPELPAVAFTRYHNPKTGSIWSITVRAGLTGDEAKAALRSLWDQIAMVDAMAMKETADKPKWLPIADGRDQFARMPEELPETPKPKAPAPKAEAPAAPAPKAKPAAPAPKAPAPVAPAPAGNGNGDEIEMNAQSIVRHEVDGSLYFTVRGDKWLVHGARLWPDAEKLAVLVDHVDLDSMEPGTEYDITWANLIAVCTITEKGNPGKVLRFREA